tara:strand:+ start:45 stop:344 length:300 start_codon:yes stop_codon:yes gene_type:complete
MKTNKLTLKQILDKIQPFEVSGEYKGGEINLDDKDNFGCWLDFSMIIDSKIEDDTRVLSGATLKTLTVWVNDSDKRFITDHERHMIEQELVKNINFTNY